MEASQDPNIENIQPPGKLYHFIMKSDMVPARPHPTGGAATPFYLFFCLHCMTPSRESSVRVERNSSCSHFSALMSDSTVAVPGKTVESPPQNCRSLAHLVPRGCHASANPIIVPCVFNEPEERSRSELLPRTNETRARARLHHSSCRASPVLCCRRNGLLAPLSTMVRHLARR
jgi:hypothetical protein